MDIYSKYQVLCFFAFQQNEIKLIINFFFIYFNLKIFFNNRYLNIKKLKYGLFRKDLIEQQNLKTYLWNFRHYVKSVFYKYF